MFEFHMRAMARATTYPRHIDRYSPPTSDVYLPVLFLHVDHADIYSSLKEALYVHLIR